MTRPFDLVLASASPRRRELLQRLGLVLRLAPVDLDETPQPDERPGDCVRRLAAAKCDAAVAALQAQVTAAAKAPEALPELAALLADGGLSVPVWRSYPLAEAAQAHADLDAGRNHGKVILLP